MVHENALTCKANMSSVGVVAAQNHARQTTLASLLDRWLERRRVESRGRSLNAAVKLRRTHIMCMSRKSCGEGSGSKYGTRRPDQQAAVVWCGGKEGEVEDTRG